MIRVLHGDCLAILPTLEAESVHACVTDPPYALKFMGKAWDNDIASRPETWEAVLRVMKPGAHLLAFGGTRTYHRMACAIEDAGFEIRDCIMWVYGSGFPKSHDVSKAIDRAAGAEREEMGRKNTGKGWGKDASGAFDGAFGYETDFAITAPATPEAAQWAGWGTKLKPSVEPIIVARKPISGTVAANVLAHGCGALNVDACRVATADGLNGGAYSGNTRRRDEYSSTDTAEGAVALSRLNRGIGEFEQPIGRWPANLAHDGSDEVEQAFAAFGESKSTDQTRVNVATTRFGFGDGRPEGRISGGFSDTGSASRFFFCAKADAADRAGSRHPTIKPLSLMNWLCRLVCPPNGTVLDPFAGSGTTLLAADRLGMNAIGIEQSAEYVADIHRRLAEDAPLLAEPIVTKTAYDAQLSLLDAAE